VYLDMPGIAAGIVVNMLDSERLFGSLDLFDGTGMVG
jgi:hypothetical protein